MKTEPIPLGSHEAHVKQLKPVHGLKPTNINDVLLFLYEWFAHFEHAAPTAVYLIHLDNKNTHLTFPGAAPLTSHADFAGWYENLFAQTLWNFHDLSAIQIKRTASQDDVISFLVDWYGEIKPGSDQLAGWHSRSDSFFY